MLFELKELKGAFDITIKIGACVWKAIKCICITIAYVTTIITVAIGIKKRRKE